MHLKDYYDTYEKHPDEGVCVICGKPTRFYGFSSFPEPYKRTCSRKCSSLDPQHWDNYRASSLEKYGETNYTKTTEYKNRRAQSKHNKFSLMTTFEQQVYTKLITKFNDVQFSYMSNDYPWECDFYIPSIDTYIECNNYWTHGPHQFNPDNAEDIALLNIWKTKDNISYKSAIYIWTIDDVNKLTTAKQNGLNYIMIYSFKEFAQWFSTV